MIKSICLVGGGSLTHVIAGWLYKKGLEVSILTRRPDEWCKKIIVNTPDYIIDADIKCISDNPKEVISNRDVILLTVPGYANENEIISIRSFLKKGTYVGGVFCSSGFFFHALHLLPEDIKIWGFQRVPFISRVEKYGHRANLLGYRAELKIAIERASEKEKVDFSKWIEESFGSKTTLMNNYLEVSVTNSNPILHTSRLYTLFSDWPGEKRSDHNILFYEEWTREAAQLLIEMDAELFKILEYLPVSKNYLMPILEYYESNDAESLRQKLISISGFKGILSPMKKVDDGWIPDYSNRYFTEDFGFSLRYIWELGKKYDVEIPNIDKVYKCNDSVKFEVVQPWLSR